jgi:hypothetical protein
VRVQKPWGAQERRWLTSPPKMTVRAACATCKERFLSKTGFEGAKYSLPAHPIAQRQALAETKRDGNSDQSLAPAFPGTIAAARSLSLTSRTRSTIPSIFTQQRYARPSRREPTALSPAPAPHLRASALPPRRGANANPGLAAGSIRLPAPRPISRLDALFAQPSLVNAVIAPRAAFHQRQLRGSRRHVTASGASLSTRRVQALRLRDLRSGAGSPQTDPARTSATRGDSRRRSRHHRPMRRRAPAKASVRTPPSRDRARHPDR